MARPRKKRKYTKRITVTETLSPTSAVGVSEVNHPAHYNQGKVEIIDIVEQIIRDYPGHMASNLGEVIKYIARAPYKGEMAKDLKKAQWYMNRGVGNADNMSEG